jgi:hypothetical protein
MAEEREDFLTEDADVPGQKFCLLSFLSPEKVLANKDMFFFETFLKSFELSFRVKTFETYLMNTIKGVNDKLNSEADAADLKDLSGVAQTLRDSRVRVDTVMDSLQKYFKAKQDDLTSTKLKELYDDFMFANKVKLEEEFFTLNEFRTSVRGLKIRGSYNSKEEAVARSKKLQRSDPVHNIFVAEVGKWLPWDPAPSDVPEQEYAEEQLNTLMKKYKENEEARELFERENRETASKKKSIDVKPSENTVAEGSAGAEGAEGAEGVAGAAANPEYHSMFGSDGPADLAIARKMAAKNLD